MDTANLLWYIIQYLTGSDRIRSDLRYEKKYKFKCIITMYYYHVCLFMYNQNYRRSISCTTTTTTQCSTSSCLFNSIWLMMPRPAVNKAELINEIKLQRHRQLVDSICFRRRRRRRHVFFLGIDGLLISFLSVIIFCLLLLGIDGLLIIVVIVRLCHVLLRTTATSFGHSTTTTTTTRFEFVNSSVVIVIVEVDPLYYSFRSGFPSRLCSSFRLLLTL